MATKTLNAAAFTAKLLAPLPADVEQITDKNHLRVILGDMQRVWDSGMAHVKLASHVRDVAWWKHVIAGRDTSSPEYATYCRLMNAVGDDVARQMLIPAPKIKELRWKREQAAAWRYAEDVNVIAVMARDEARLAPKKEA